MNYNDENLLQMVELYASEMGYIASAEEASERFDELVTPEMKDDQIMLYEEFANWMDALCKDGEIHIEQYKNYEYCGNYFA